MKELIDHIPFIDLFVLITVALFIYAGWKQGTPRALMVTGAIYSGFLLASIYYHLFALALTKVFHLGSHFMADLLSFLVLDTLVTLLMSALLLGVFGHIKIGGRIAVFDRIAGSLVGMASSLLLVAIVITVLHAPYEANKTDLTFQSQVPAVGLFNDGYDKSMLGPQFTKASPYLVKGIAPLLPARAREKGAVPLLESVVSKK